MIEATESCQFLPNPRKIEVAVFLEPAPAMSVLPAGSGTIPIEAAMIGMNIAPGLNREFACEDWSLVPSSTWSDTKQEARDLIRHDRELQIIGSDCDAKVLDLARFHADKAGVKKQIGFEHRDFQELESGVE